MSSEIKIQLHPVTSGDETDEIHKIGSLKDVDEQEQGCSTRSNSNNFCSNSELATDSNSTCSVSEAADGDGGSVIDDPNQNHLHSMGRTRTYEIKVRNLSYAIVLGKTSLCVFHPCGGQKPVYNILKNISCDAKPGEILAIVGPSGAGKSTLLEILAGRIRPSRTNSRNSILVNDKPVNPSQFRRISGYVTQEDALLPLLTVKETLMFSAWFRLPPSVSKQEKEAKVESLISELGLVHVSDTRIGDESIRGVSGGERRRVSIGVDVIHDPAVLLLDEPTSGLDSAAALHVVEMLHTMAREAHQRTIILTIHQPSYRILTLISSVLLLAKGTVVHHGSLKSLQDSLLSAGRKIPAQLNALEYAMEIISETAALTEEEDSSIPKFWEEKSTTGHDFDMPVTDPNEPTQRNEDNNLVVVDPETVLDDESDNADEDKITFANSRCSEICTLSCRFWKIIYRTQQLFLARTLQAIVGGVGLGSVYLKVGYNQRGLDERLGFFAFTLTFLLSSTTEALPIFLQERQILMRETSRGAYRVSSYVISNTLVFLPFLLIVAILFAVPVYWLVGLSSTWNAFLFFLFIVWLIVLMANSLVVFLSALAPDFITGNSLIFTILGAFFLFSGYFISKDNIPKYWLFMHYLSLYKYPLDSLLINEYSSLATKCFSWLPEFNVCALTGEDILKQRGLHKDRRWMNVEIMIGFVIFYRILCFWILMRRASKAKR
eukprot:Gb_19188 [translate_table: standard]